MPWTIVYDNLKRFREGQSEIRCLGSGRKKFFDVNDNARAAQRAASHPNLSAQQIASECVRRGSSLVLKWIMGWTLARSNYFKSVPQMVPLMTAEHKRNSMRYRSSEFQFWCDFYGRKSTSVLQMYSEKVDKIWTSSNNGAEVYGVGLNKQVRYKSTCFCKWGRDNCCLILWQTIYPVFYNGTTLDRTPQPIPVNGSHRITWP